MQWKNTAIFSPGERRQGSMKREAGQTSSCRSDDFIIAVTVLGEVQRVISV